MSKSHAHHPVCTVMHDIQCMTLDELEERYSIEVDEDGYVWDTLEGKGFDDLQEWAIYTEELEEASTETPTFIPRSGKARYDDDY